jgi:hypothetical protein
MGSRLGAQHCGLAQQLPRCGRAASAYRLLSVVRASADPRLTNPTFGGARSAAVKSRRSRSAAKSLELPALMAD